jgi:hypothetical protein
MWTKLQRAVVAVLEECLSVNAKEFFGSFGGDPAFDGGHGAEKRVLSYDIEHCISVKVFNMTLRFLLHFETNLGKVK